MRRGRAYTDTEPGARFGKVSVEDVDVREGAAYWGPDHERAAPRVVIP